MTHDQADRIISLLEKILDRLTPAQQWPRLGPVVPEWPAPMMPTPAPYPQPAPNRDCGCAITAVCGNAYCPRRTNIICQQASDATVSKLG